MVRDNAILSFSGISVLKDDHWVTVSGTFGTNIDA